MATKKEAPTKTKAELQADAESAAILRSLKAKQQEEAFYVNELARMREERAKVKSIAASIAKQIDKFEDENAKSITGDISGAEKMETCISRFTSNSSKAYEALMEMSKSFDIQQASTQEVVDEIKAVVPGMSESGSFGADAEPVASGETKAESASDHPMELNGIKTMHKEATKRQSLATSKLRDLFTQGGKEYNSLVMSMADDGDEEESGPAKEAEAIVPMLQRKVTSLTNAFQLASIKADAVGVQWIADKEKFYDETNKMQKTMEIMDIKLQVATGKTRFSEQVMRDPNMVSNVVSRAEYDELRRQLQEQKQEMAIADVENKEIKSEFASLKTRAYEAERTKGDMEAVISSQTKELKKAATEAEKLVKEIASADEKFAEKQKGLLQELERTKDDVRKANQQAKEDLKAINLSNKELQKSVDDFKKRDEQRDAEGGGGAEKALVEQLMSMQKSLAAFERSVNTEESKIGEMLRKQAKRLENLKKEANTAGTTLASAGGDPSRAGTRPRSRARTPGNPEVEDGDVDEVEQAMEERDAAVAELAEMKRQWAQEKSALETEVASLAGDAGSSTRGSSRKGRSRSGSPSRGRTPGALTDGGDGGDGMDPPLEITDADLQAALEKSYAAASRRGRSKKGVPGAQEAAAFGEKTKKAMKKQLLKKMRAYSNVLVDSVDADEEEFPDAPEGSDPAHLKVCSLLTKFATNILETVDSCADRIAPRLAELPSAGDGGDDQSFASALTSDSIGFDAGDDPDDMVEEEGGWKPLTAAEEVEMDRLKEQLRDGNLGVDIGTVRRENFDRLKDKQFGNEDLIELTMMEHHLRYDTGIDESEMFDGPEAEVMKTKAAGAAAAAQKKQEMQLKMMSMLQDEIFKRVIEDFSFSELSTFKVNSEKDMLLLKSFSALRAIKFYAEGGNFMDVLSTHRDILDRAIIRKGGWKKAFEEVRATTTRLDPINLPLTTHWPEFFRVKVLEFYKRALQSQQKNMADKLDGIDAKWQIKMDAERKKTEEAISFGVEMETALEELKTRKKRPLRALGMAAVVSTKLKPAAAVPDPPVDGSPIGSPGSKKGLMSALAGAVDADETSVDSATKLFPDSPSANGDPDLKVPKLQDRRPPSPLLLDAALASSRSSRGGMNSARSNKGGLNSARSNKDALGSARSGGNHSARQMSSRSNKSAQLSSRSNKSDRDVATEALKSLLPESSSSPSSASVQSERQMEEGDNVVVVNKADAVTAKLNKALNALNDSEDNAKAETLRLEREELEKAKTAEALGEMATINEEDESAPRKPSAAEMLSFRLHRNADKVWMRMVEKEHNALCMGELVLNGIDSWRQEFMDDAYETFHDILTMFPDDEQLPLIHDLLELLAMEVPPTREAVEVHDKFQMMINHIDAEKHQSDDDVSELGDSDMEDEEEVADAVEVPVEGAVEGAGEEAPVCEPAADETAGFVDKASEISDAPPPSSPVATPVQSKKASKKDSKKESKGDNTISADLALEQKKLDENKAKLAMAWKEYDSTKVKWVASQSKSMEHVRKMSEDMTKFEAECDEKKAQLLQMERDIYDKSAALDDKKTAFDRDCEHRSDALDQTTLDLNNLKESLAEERESFESDRALMEEAQKQLDIEKIDLAKEWEDFFAAENKTQEELLYEDEAGPTESYMKKQNTMTKTTSQTNTRAAAVDDDELPPGSDVRKMLPKGMTFDKIVKAQIAILEKKETNLEGKMIEFSENLRENKLRLQKEKLAAFKSKASVAKQLNDIAKEKKSLEKRVESVRKQEMSLVESKIEIENRKIHHEAELHDMRDKLSMELEIARKKSQEAANALKHAQERIKEEVEAAIAAAGLDGHSHHSPRSEGERPPAQQAPGVQLVPASLIDEIKRQDAQHEQNAVDEAIKRTHEEEQLRAYDLHNAPMKKGGIGTIGGTVALMTKLARKRKQKTADKKRQEEIEAIVKERVAVETREKIALAMALTQVDQMECGTQTIEFASTEPEQDDHDDDFVESLDSAVVVLNTHPLTPPPVLPPGFFLVHCTEKDLQVCPGVQYASYARLRPEDQEKVPPHVMYVYRGEGEAYINGIKRLPQYVWRPRNGMEGTEVVTIPASGLEIVPGVKLLIGAILPPHLELTPDVHVCQIAHGVSLPPGMSRVELDSNLNIYSDFLGTVPKGVEMVQSNFAINLPVGCEIAPDVLLVKAPRSAPPLPPTLHFVKRNLGAEMPKFLVPIISLNAEDSDVYVSSKMAESCTIIKRPFGLNLSLGMEILARPPGHSVPAGMSIVPLCDYPESLKASNYENKYMNFIRRNNYELVQLVARMDLPDTCIFDGCWGAFPRPTGMRLPPGVGLFNFIGQGNGSAGLLPSYLRPVPMPDIPYGVSLPPSVLSAEYLLDSTCCLPAGTQLQEGLRVISLDAIRPIETRENPNGKMRTNKASRPKLDWNLCVCERKSGDFSSHLPDLVERASTASLPAGVLLDQNMEIVQITVRYELPAGVKTMPGVKLGPRVQLSPGTILNNQLEVCEWPHGVNLDPGTEMVRFLQQGMTQLPQGFEQIMFTQAELQHRRLPLNLSESGVIIIKIPKLCKIESNQILAEAVSVIEIRDEVCRRFDNYEKMRKSGMFAATAKNPFASLLEPSPEPEEGKLARQYVSDECVSQVSLPPGCILIRRDLKTSQLPSGLRILEKASLTVPLRKFLGNNPGGDSSQELDAANRKRKNLGLRPKKSQGVEVAQLDPTYSLPVGTELEKGLNVLRKPAWLLPVCQYQWLELVSQADLLNCANSDEWRARRVEIRPELMPADVLAALNKLRAAKSDPLVTTTDASVVDATVTLDAAAKADTTTVGVDVNTAASAAGAGTGTETSTSVDAAEQEKLAKALRQEHLNDCYLLPGDTVLVSIPKYFQVYSWGSAAPGIEVICQHEAINEGAKKGIAGGTLTPRTPMNAFAVAAAAANKKAAEDKAKMTESTLRYSLPRAHFFVQRPRKAKPPLGMRLGLHTKFQSMQHMFADLPPGVEIVHLEATYHLCCGLTISNATAVRAPAVLNEDSSTATGGAADESGSSQGVVNYDHNSIYGAPLSSTPQLAIGQQLGPSVSVLPHPPGWLGRDNRFLYLAGSKQDALDSGYVMASQLSTRPLVFVQVRGCSSTVQAQALLPRGATVHPYSGKAVAQFFELSGVAESELPTPGLTPAVTPGNLARGMSRNLLESYSNNVTGITNTIMLVELHRDLPSSRQLLKDGKPKIKRDKDGKPMDIVPEELPDAEASMGAIDKNTIRTHLMLRNPLLRDPPVEEEPSRPSTRERIDEKETAETQVGADVLYDMDEVTGERRLDADGDPIMLDVHGLPLPKVKYQLDEDGQAMLDADGKRIPLEVTTNNAAADAVVVEEEKPEVQIVDGLEIEAERPEDEEEVKLMPSAEELMRSLEMAQSEIYELEDANNKILVSLKEVKNDRVRKIRRLAIYAFRQQSRDKGFMSLRSEISDLKADIIKRDALVKMKFEDARKLVAERNSLRDRMQKQIDVLNKQLAHSIDANEVVREERVVMESDFKRKQEVQAQHMSTLYDNMKEQSRQYLHLCCATMFLSVEGIVKQAKEDALELTAATTSLASLTAQVRAYNQAAISNGSAQVVRDTYAVDAGPLDAAPQQPTKQRNQPQMNMNQQFNDDVSVDASLFSQLSTSQDVSLAGSMASGHSLSSESKSVMSMAGAAFDPRSKPKDTWRHAKIEKRMNGSMEQQQQRERPVSREISLSQEMPVGYGAYTNANQPSGDTQHNNHLVQQLLDIPPNSALSAPPSPDAYLFDHDTIPLPTTPFGTESFAIAPMDDDISILSEDSNFRVPSSPHQRSNNAKVPLSQQGPTLQNQLHNMDIMSAQKGNKKQRQQQLDAISVATSVRGGPMSKEKRKRNKRNISDNGSVMSEYSSPSVAASQVSLSTPTKGNATYSVNQQHVIAQSKADLQSKREFIGVAAKMALREQLPVGDKGQNAGQMLRPIVTNRTPQGSPIVLSAREAAAEMGAGRRNQNFARLPSPIQSDRRHASGSHLKNSNAVSGQAATALALGSGLSTGTIHSNNVGVSPFLGVEAFNDIITVEEAVQQVVDMTLPQWFLDGSVPNSDAFKKLVTALDSAMGASRIEGVRSMESNTLANRFSSSPTVQSSSVTPVNLPITDSLSRPDTFGAADAPGSIGADDHHSTFGRSDSEENGGDIHGFKPEAVKAAESIADATKKSTEDLYHVLMAQLKSDGQGPPPVGYLTADVHELHRHLQQEGRHHEFATNSLMKNANETIQAWSSGVQSRMKEHQNSEKKKYLKAMGLAEVELQYMLATRRVLDSKLHEAEQIVSDMHQKQRPVNQHGDIDMFSVGSNSNSSVGDSRRGKIGASELAQASVREMALLRRVSDLEATVNRLHTTGAFKSSVDVVTAQANDAMSLKDLEQELKLQSLVFDARAGKEAKRIALGEKTNEELPENERKAVLHLIKSLKAQSKAYSQRARIAREEYNKLMHAMVDDVNAYEQQLTKILPKKSLLNLLRWSTEKKDSMESVD